MNDPLLEESPFDPVEVASSGDAHDRASANAPVEASVGSPKRGPADVSLDATRRPRRRYVLEDDTGFDEVPKKYRRFYRRWGGAGDVLAPNEVLCPVCRVVIRSSRELRVGDRVYCMPCMSRLTVVRGEEGRLEAGVEY